MASWSDLPTSKRGGVAILFVVALIATAQVALYVFWHVFVADPRDLSNMSWALVLVVSAVAAIGWVGGLVLLRHHLHGR